MSHLWTVYMGSCVAAAAIIREHDVDRSRWDRRPVCWNAWSITKALVWPITLAVFGIMNIRTVGEPE